MKIVVPTGNETRHTLFRLKLTLDPRFEVPRTCCEGAEKGLVARTRQSASASALELAHLKARSQSETDFFADFIEFAPDKSRPVFIQRGEINADTVVESITELRPDLLVCYASSLVKSKLLDVFKGRFLNVLRDEAPRGGARTGDCTVPQ